MGPVETLQAWNQLARIDVNQRAAELGLSHLIHIGPRVINLAPNSQLSSLELVSAAKAFEGFVKEAPLTLKRTPRAILKLTLNQPDPNPNVTRP